MTYENLKDKDTDLSKILNSNKQKINNASLSGNIIASADFEIRESLVEMVNLASLNANWKGYVGCCFDGQYVYLCPFYGSVWNGYFVRYDVSLPFDVVGSYETFNLASINAAYTGWKGATFDGRYVYMVQTYDGTAGRLLRYDTQASFTSSGSYSIIDLKLINTNYTAFQSMAFDGRYIYTLGYLTAGTRKGVKVRYDTTLAFSSGNIEIFDTTTVDSSYKGHSDLINGGKYIYYVPYNNDSAPFGLVCRHKIGGTFDASSFEYYDLSTINADWVGFYGGCYDGRYIYYSTYTDSLGGYSGLIIRYDTTKPFNEPGSYEELDRTDFNSNHKTSFGLNFDGRFIYTLPSLTDGGVYHQNISKIDTTKAFDSNMMKGFDASSIDSNYKGFYGGCYDGKYIYFIPYYSGSFHGYFMRIRTSITNRLGVN